MDDSFPSAHTAPGRAPSLWAALPWAWRHGNEGGGVSRGPLVVRTLLASVMQGGALHRWMQMVLELHERGLFQDIEVEYLRAVRPSVHRHTGVRLRVQQLIDHYDWLDTAFQPVALLRLAGGQPLTLVELRPPRGYSFAGVQLRRSGCASPEGELLLTLTLQREAAPPHQPLPMEVAAVAFSRLRVGGEPSLAIGGVRGQRGTAQRASQTELAQALQGWQPAVLLVQVMQELAKAWDLPLAALHPDAHRLRGWLLRLRRRHRDAGHRVAGSYQALWTHFGAAPSAPGWVQLPLQSGEKPADTDVPADRRERQMRRADFWLRTRKAMHQEFRGLLQRPGHEDLPEPAADAATDQAALLDEWDALFADDEREGTFPRVSLDTGPQSLPP